MRERNKTAKRHGYSNSIDGFVSNGKPIGVGSSGSRLGSSRPHASGYQPSTQALGNFERRTDGFHGTSQPRTAKNPRAAEVAERDALLEEPIVIDDMDYQQRKKRFHGKLRRRPKKLLKRGALVLLVLLIGTGAFIGYRFYQTRNTLLAGGGNAPAVCDGNVPTSLLKQEGDGRVNILLLGIGSEGLLTDTIMIVSIDPFTDKMDLLSIPRDLWVNIPGNGQEKINAAYSYGQKGSSSKSAFSQKKAGVELLDKILEDILGVTIHYHSVLDFKAFKQTVDALGGISVRVPETLYDPTIAWENQYNPVIASKGIQQFNGSRALLYAKSRQTSSDFARSERQRLLLVAIKEKALSAGTYSNPIKVVSLLNSLGKNVYTDFDTRSIKCLYEQSSEIQSSQINSLDLVTPPNDLLTTGSLYGRSVDQPKAGLFEYGDIRKFVRTKFRDGFLAKENASVAVYNATNSVGLATKTADILKMYGYNIKVVENSPNRTNPSSTVVVDLSKGKNKYTEYYLEKRFGVSTVGSLPDGLGATPPQGTAFVIIVGANAATSN